MKMLIAGFLLFFTSLSFALDCPKLKLECQLQKLGPDFSYRTVSLKTEGFSAFNRDEPSLSPDTCEIGLVVSAEELNQIRGPKEAKQTESLYVTIHEDLQSFFRINQGYTLIGGQFQTKAAINSPMILHLKETKMICTLFDPSQKDPRSDD